MAATKTLTVFLNVTPCNLLDVHPRFGGTFVYHNQGTGNIPEISNLIAVVAGSSETSLCIYICVCVCVCVCRSQWPRGLRRRSAAARLLRSWVQILPGAWMFVCCECCVLSGSLCEELITCPGESYRLWCVVVCDLETSRMRRP